MNGKQGKKKMGNEGGPNPPLPGRGGILVNRIFDVAILGQIEDFD
jgi:hypothetical protein